MSAQADSQFRCSPHLCTQSTTLARVACRLVSWLALMPLAYKPRTTFEGCPIMGLLASPTLVASKRRRYAEAAAATTTAPFANTTCNTNQGCCCTHRLRSGWAAQEKSSSRLCLGCYYSCYCCQWRGVGELGPASNTSCATTTHQAWD